MKPPEYRDIFDAAATRVTIRTMQASDRDIEQQFIRDLSPLSRYYRFHSALKELTPYMLERLTQLNYPDEMALIATVQENDQEREIGVARYARYPGTDRAEIAVVVADDWQRKGIGSRLMLDLRDLARQVGVRHFEANVLPVNRRVLEWARARGFSIKPLDPGESPVFELGKEIEKD